MAFVLADRVKESTVSPGTGTATLGGAASGYQSFSAGIGASNTTYYVIADQAGANWEVGLGTIGAGGTTLARTTVYASSNSGSLVNFASGTQDVWCDYPASKYVSKDSIYAPGTFQGTFTDGIVVDYATGNGRISVGSSDGITFYNGGVANTNIGSVSSGGAWTLPADSTIHGVTVGQGAGSVSTNNVLGSSALASNTTGNNNVAVGTSALNASTTASYNTAVGQSAGQNVATGQYNTLLGSSAGFNLANTSSYNVAVGSQALQGNSTASNNSYNIAVGYQPLQLATYGALNIGLGYRAIQAAQSGSNNIGIGYQSLQSIGQSVNAGSFVIGLSYTILSVGTTSFTSIGALSNTVGTTFTATGVGSGTGTAALNNTNNTAIGYNSGNGITSGNNNTIIGAYTGSAAPVSATGSNYIVVSDGQGNVPVYWKGTTSEMFVGGTSGTAGQVLTSGGSGVAPSWQAAAGGFPSGTALLFQQTAAPTGWTKVTTYNDAALRVVSGTAGTGGTVAFSTAFSASNTVDGTAISTAQMPSHTHTYSNNTGYSSGVNHNHQFPGAAVAANQAFLIGAGGQVTYGDTSSVNNTNNSNPDHYHGSSGTTAGTGSGGSHNHTTANFAVKYVDIIIATKN